MKETTYDWQYGNISYQKKLKMKLPEDTFVYRLWNKYPGYHQETDQMNYENEAADMKENIYRMRSITQEPTMSKREKQQLEKKIEDPQYSIVLKFLKKYGFECGSGLGLKKQGILEPVQINLEKQQQVYLQLSFKPNKKLIFENKYQLQIESIKFIKITLKINNYLVNKNKKNNLQKEMKLDQHSKNLNNIIVSESYKIRKDRRKIISKVYIRFSKEEYSRRKYKSLFI